MKKPIITVYVLSHNYEAYLTQAIESVLTQSREDWELIIIDDGSSDNSAHIARSFADDFPENIRTVVHDEPKGLQSSANEALRMARGKYVLRLDADDYLDQNAFLVLAHQLDVDDDAALVYPSYIYVDESGNHLGVEHRWRIGGDAVVPDQPAHGACTMVRKRILKAIGGYDESNDRQDGHELWLKVVNRYKVVQLDTPLFYYRQHPSSLSTDRTELLRVRAKIKRSLVERAAGPVAPTIIAIVGAKNTYPDMPNIVLNPIAGRPLIDYTIMAALEVPGLNHVVVSTDDQEVVNYCNKNYPSVLARMRSPKLSLPTTVDTELLLESVEAVEDEEIWPDIIVSLGVHTPLRHAEHVRKAIDTLLLYDVDTVISVHENHDLYYVHGNRGLEPINPSMHRRVRVEREVLFEGNGAVRVLWRDLLDQQEGFKPKVGHIVMPGLHGIHIKSAYDAWLAEQLLLEKGDFGRLRPYAW